MSEITVAVEEWAAMEDRLKWTQERLEEAHDRIIQLEAAMERIKRINQDALKFAYRFQKVSRD